jgi:hypothetical protein
MIAAGSRCFYSLRQMFKSRAMTKSVVVAYYGRNMAFDRDGYDKTEYMGEENIKKDIWTSARARNVEKKNKSGIEGAV